MKKYLLIILSLAATTYYAQLDSVILLNGLKSTIKVVSTYGNSITYTVPGDASGTTYTLKKNEIKKLYLNTNLDQNDNKTTEKKQKQPGSNSNTTDNGKLEDFSRNLVGYNVGQMLFTTVSFNYQHILKEGVLGIKVYGGGNLAPRTMSTYFDPNTNSLHPTINGGELFMPVYRKFTAGVELNLFPVYQRKVAYYVGPGFQFGSFDASYNVTTTVNPPFPQSPYTVTEAKKVHAQNISFILNNGILFRLTPNFFMDWSAGIGIQRIDFGDMGQDARPRGSFQVSMGYSF